MATADTPTLVEAARAALAAADPVRRPHRPGARAAAAASSSPTGYVLTNAHNLRDRTTEVTFADGRAVQGRGRRRRPRRRPRRARGRHRRRPVAAVGRRRRRAGRRRVRGRPHRRRRRPHHPRAW